MSQGSVATGVVLAGGQSRRMGGGDKGLLDLAGTTMLGRVLERFRPQVARLLINANGDPARFGSFNLPVEADSIDGFAGPLAGVLTGMRWSLRHAPDARTIVTVSSDVPFVPLDLVARFQTAAAGRTGVIAVAQSGTVLHRVIALWPVALADDLEGHLRAGVRKVVQWTDRHQMIPVAFEPLQLGPRLVDPFFNVNTQADADFARTILAEHSA